MPRSTCGRSEAARTIIPKRATGLEPATAGLEGNPAIKPKSPGSQVTEVFYRYSQSFAMRRIQLRFFARLSGITTGKW